jgi:hypothetical protein
MATHSGKQNDFHASLCKYFSCFLLHGGHAKRKGFSRPWREKNVGDGPYAGGKSEIN